MWGKKWSWPVLRAYQAFAWRA